MDIPDGADRPLYRPKGTGLIGHLQPQCILRSPKLRKGFLAEPQSGFETTVYIEVVCLSVRDDLKVT